MANINLLPWRENLRARRQKEFGAMMLVGILLTATVLAAWHFYNESLIDQQKRRNAYLEQRIAEVAKQIKEIKSLERTRKQLIDRMKVVSNLQSSRPQVVHLFDELVTSLPEGVHLTKVTQAGGAVAVLGRAQSNARVSAYMRAIEASPWLAKPSLKIIEQKGDEDSPNTFSLGMVQVVPKAEGQQ